MIYWTDFLMTDVTGPILVLPPEEQPEEEQKEEKVCRGTQPGKPSPIPSVMEDAKRLESQAIIQETGQEQQPARMVGLSGLDSFKSGTDASREGRAKRPRHRGEIGGVVA